MSEVMVVLIVAATAAINAFAGYWVGYYMGRLRP